MGLPLPLMLESSAWESGALAAGFGVVSINFEQIQFNMRRPSVERCLFTKTHVSSRKTPLLHRSIRTRHLDLLTAINFHPVLTRFSNAQSDCTL